jgi:phosphoglycolate phosphatase-like HAD superfamily hydrolase
MEGISLTRKPLQARTRNLEVLGLPKVLLCDLDGTLIDTMPILADLAMDVISDIYGTPKPLARELYLATCGLPFIGQLGDIFPNDPRNPTASDRFEAAKPARCRSARMPASTISALASLQSRGVRIVVSSNNGRENVETFAQDSGFPFDLVLGYGNGLAKGRTHIQMIERVFGAGRAELLFIGDSLHDGDIAAREGLPFVGLTGTFSRESFQLRFPAIPVVHQFADLLDLFEWTAAAAVG